MAITPMDLLLDRVEWCCTRCGIPQRQGCHCFDRTTAVQKQALCDLVRKRVRALLKTTCPVVWMHRSARTSLLNRCWNAVHTGLARLDGSALPETPLTAAECAVLAERVCWDLDCYWLSMYPNLYASMAPAFLQRFLTQVAAAIEAVLAWHALPGGSGGA
jgi:hypothetical protein